MVIQFLALALLNIPTHRHARALQCWLAVGHGGQSCAVRSSTVRQPLYIIVLQAVRRADVQYTYTVQHDTLQSDADVRTPATPGCGITCCMCMYECPIQTRPPHRHTRNNSNKPDQVLRTHLEARPILIPMWSPCAKSL